MSHAAPPTTVELVERLYGLDQDLVNDPFDVYKAMRQTAPVIRNGPLVTVSRYEDARAVLRDDKTFSSIRHIGTRVSARRAQIPADQLEKFDALVQSEGRWLTETDEPIHGRLRRFVNATFSAKRVAELRETVEAVTQELLDELDTTRTNTFDLISDFSYRMPLHVICRLLGATGPRIDMIRDWSEAIGKGIGTEYSNVDEAYDALTHFVEYVTELIEHHRSGARTDSANLFAELVAPDAQGQVLSDDDLIAMYVQLLFAGHETTTNLIANAIVALHENPEQAALVREDPTLMRPAVDELLRYCGSIHAIHRVATRDCEIAGFAVNAGETVRILIASANRDETVFEHPDELDIQRPNARQHVGLGYGIHTCLGQWLTRLETDVALTELLRRYPDIAPAEPVVMRRNITLHGPERLLVSV